MTLRIDSRVASFGTRRYIDIHFRSQNDVPQKHIHTQRMYIYLTSGFVIARAVGVMLKESPPHTHTPLKTTNE